MNSFINDVFERVAGESGKLTRYNKKPTLSSRKVQTTLIVESSLVEDGKDAEDKLLDKTTCGARVLWHGKIRSV